MVCLRSLQRLTINLTTLIVFQFCLMQSNNNTCPGSCSFMSLVSCVFCVQGSLRSILTPHAERHPLPDSPLGPVVFSSEASSQNQCKTQFNPLTECNSIGRNKFDQVSPLLFSQPSTEVPRVLPNTCLPRNFYLKQFVNAVNYFSTLSRSSECNFPSRPPGKVNIRERLRDFKLLLQDELDNSPQVALSLSYILV